MKPRLAVLLLLALPAFGRAEEVVRTFSVGEAEPTRDLRHFQFSPEVVAEKDGIRLAHSVLLTDEMGATDFRQTETLSDTVWARKTFQLKKREATAAELFLFGSAKEVRFNEKVLEAGRRLESTGWQRVPVPTDLLKQGANEAWFGRGGQLLIEPGRGRGHSARTLDGGGWSVTDGLGRDGNPGEYLVRLRLGQSATRGQVESPVFDLWADRFDAVATAGRVQSMRSPVPEEQQNFNAVQPWVRLGSGPSPTASGWTDWLPLPGGQGQLELPGEATRYRWAQLRFDLSATGGRVTPRLPNRFELKYDLVPEPPKDAPPLTVTVPDPWAYKAMPGSVRFTYQAPSPRLQKLRERCKLDDVIAPGKTEMEQLTLLRHWARHQWHTAWEGGADAWMPPWDAHIILDGKDQPTCLTMCTHYAAFYVQCCEALGWNARHVVLDHHCVSEVWVDQHRKWVMMDVGNSKERPDCNLHFERNGVPLSALELHRLARGGDAAGVEVRFTSPALAEKVAALCRPAPPPKKPFPPRPDVVPLADLGKYPVCGLANYRRYALPPRNNFLDSPLPGELYQGWSEYFYDGYFWVGDSPDDPKLSPEYSRHLTPDRPQDIDWPLNWTRIHPARTDKADEVRVTLESGTPNLGRLEVRIGDGPWKATPPTFTLPLPPKGGKLTIEARGVNRFDRAGPATTVVVGRP
jgi:hypothetical protein